ncbi:MAG: hypothetical protein ACMUIG_02505 [Thermoplasmatota archaeon]
MVEEKEVKLPNSVIKGMFFLLMVLGVVLLVVWTAMMIIREGRFFDLGLYSITSVMILGGLTGTLLYRSKEKAEA